MKYTTAKLLICAVIACGISLPSAYAACVTPTAIAGKVIYNSTYNVVQYCNGKDWINTGGKNPSSTMVGCTSPTSPAGRVIFNTTYHVHQFCNGQNWMNMACSYTAGGSGTGCVSPPGAAGAIIYNSSVNKLQLCDGTKWLNAGVGAGCTPNAPCSTSLASGLVDYYKFDENSGNTVADSVGSNGGTWNGTSSWTTGRINSSGNFSGSNSVQMANGLPGSSTTTVSEWVNSASTSTSQGFTYINSIDCTGAGNWGFGVYQKGSAWGFNLVTNGSEITGGTVTVGQWTHLVAVYDTVAQTQKLYVNGSLVASQAASGTPRSGCYGMIGAYYFTSNGAPTNNFKGKIDEVAVWNRALSQSEITTLYNSGNGKQPSSSTCY